MENSNLISTNLLNWYDQHKRDLPWRDSGNPYFVWVSEIMLQQTQVETVKPYFARFITALPSIEDLAKADDDLLHKLWEGLGYYSRVRNMKKAAIKIMEDFNGQLPITKKELESLPGIGPYTAGAIASIVFDQAVSAIDGNVLRVYSRLFEIDTPIERVVTKRLVDSYILETIDQDRPGDFNQALMDLGSSICTPLNPKCEACPISFACNAYKSQTMIDYPVRLAKKSVKMNKRTVLIIRKGSQVLIKKRAESGLLAGLWEYINLDGHLSKKEILNRLDKEGFQVQKITKLANSKHLFSHIHWYMQAYDIELADLASQPVSNYLTVQASFVDYQKIRRDYAIATAYQEYTTYLDILFTDLNDYKA